MKQQFMTMGALLIGGFPPAGVAQNNTHPDLILASHQVLEEVQVWGGTQGKAELPVAPTSEISALEMESINLSTIEDAVAYEPSMVVRRRFIGDANGSLGIRGANMFQTARTLIYADGLPLHYHLQTRWSGAPRWSLIAPDEVESVEVVYGPFSAVYSGNAMGGVVRIKTRTPTERSLKLHGALFNQSYERLATEEEYGGGRFSASYGDKFGDLTVFAFYNYLDNEGQPMTQYFAPPETRDSGTAVTGGVTGTDTQGHPVVYYGDSGAEGSTTDLFKLKTGYTWDSFQLYTTLAYEDRRGDANSPNNFLRDINGNTLWSGDANLDGHTFRVNGTHFSEQRQDRQSLLLGAGLTGPILGNWLLDLNVSHFEILEDVNVSSALNPADPDFTGAGRVTEYDNTGWRTLDLHTSNDHVAGRDDMTLTLGAHYGVYQLAIESFESEDYHQADRTAPRSASGGETATSALFAEYAWQPDESWDVTLGGRYEHWEAQNGFLNDEQHPDRSTNGFSPKFSLGYTPAPAWNLRYSLARALRFPLVEELYHNESRASGIQTANARLAPEDGIHHNLMLERLLGEGFVRVNLFRERVEDTIFNQLGIVDGVEISTFLAIDEITTKGIELIINQPGFVHPKLDMRFNTSYLDAEVIRNRVNPKVEGNRFPRLPQWQSNLLLTYRINDDLNVGTGLRYASNSFGELTNTDTAKRTFGAHDSYLFLNLKANWQINSHCDLALGVDNVTDQLAYVHHPWPSRTVYLEAGYEF